MSARYLCLRCWRTSSPAEAMSVAPREPEAPVPAVAPAPAPEPGPAPELETALPATVIAAPEPLPVAKPKPRAGLHWIEDPNPRPILPVAAAAAPAKAADGPAAAAKAEALGPKDRAPVGASRKSRWSGWVDSLLGEADEGEDGPGLGGSAAGRAVCRCGAALGADLLLDAPPALLGFAGAPGSGKSLLLLSMLHQLELAEGGGGRRPALEPLGETGDVFRARRRDLFRHGRRPAAAGAEAGAGYGWQLSFVPPGNSGGRSRRRPLPGGRAQLIGYFAGEAEAEAGRYHALLERVVLTLDGAVLAADLDLEAGDAWCEPSPAGDLGAADQRAFAALCRGLGPKTRATVLAIVVTKADLLAASPEWTALGPGGDLAGAEREAAIARLLKETWRLPLLEEARAKFRRVGLFASSSLGFRPSAADLGGGGELARRPQPWAVLAPLDFLLDDIAPRRA